MIGANPDELAALAAAIDNLGQTLEGRRRELTSALHSTAWKGSDAERFLGEWDQRHSLALTAVVALLGGMSKQLRFEARQQTDASAANGAGAPGPGPGPGTASGLTPAEAMTQLDQQNRQKLDADIRNLAQQLAQHETSDPAATLRQLMGLVAIKEQLDTPNRYLLSFDTEGPNGGHVVMSVGNPATAKNVTTFVPGFGSTTAKIGGDMGYATNITAAADQATGAANNATIVWLGYDAPQGVDVATSGDAQAGAAGLSDFLAQMKAGNPGAHYVVEGHSYGSVVVGWAAHQPQGLSASDVILVGSPGVPATSAGDFGVADGHLFVGERGGDPVPAAGNVSMVDFNGHLYPAGPLGLDPVNLPGAVHFDAGNDWNPLDNPLDKHSQYWDWNSTQLDNQARIITGTASPTTTG